MKKYEYTFVRLNISFWFRREPKEYKKLIEEYGLQGWRLNQIFAPALIGSHGPKFYELIFEREIQE